MQDCVSSCRRWQCTQESAGKRDGTSGTKSGNASLTGGAFAEAAALFLRNHPEAPTSLARWEQKHSTGKAWTMLAHQLARAVGPGGLPLPRA